MQKKNKYYAKLGNGGTLHITHPEKQNHKHKTSGTALTFMFCFPVVHCLTSLRYLFFSHFQSFIMSVLVVQYYSGSILVSVWFLSPGQYVYCSCLGYCFTSYLELPAGLYAHI